MFVTQSYFRVADPNVYPLLYSFSYNLGDNGPSLQLAPTQATSFLSTALPPGSSSYNFSLNVVLLVADSYGATATIESAVTVTPTGNGSGNVTSLLSDALSSSLSDSSKTVKTCNLFSTFFQGRNCETSPNCTNLNRYPCDAQAPAGTCGKCLSGFTSAFASYSNIPCLANSTSSFSSTTCVVDSDCIYQNCVTGVCVTPSKQCPSPTCSGNGTCIFRDSAGNFIDQCLVSDSYCEALCECYSGYSGASCNLDATSAASRDNARGLLCQSLLDTIAVQDPSPTLLDSLASSISVSFNPYEVTSSSSVVACANLFAAITSLVAEGYLAGASTSTANTLMEVLSNFVNTVKLSTQSSSDRRRLQSSSQNSIPFSGANVSSQIAQITAGVLNNMAYGQNPLTFETSNIQLQAQSHILTDLLGALLTPSAGGSSPTIVLPSDGLNACGQNSGYLKTTVAQWSSSPYQNSSDLKTPLLRFSSQGSAPNASLVAESNIGAFYIILPVTNSSTYNATSKTFENNTIPSCVLHSGSSFEPCGCNVSSYNALNVTFVCDSVSVLCPGAPLRRRLDNSGSVQLTDGTTLQEYGSFYSAVGQEIAEVIGVTPRAPDPIVASLVGVLAFFLISGGVFFSWWDKHDRIRIKEFVEKAHEIRRISRDIGASADSAAGDVAREKGQDIRGSLRNAIQDSLAVRFLRVIIIF